MCGLYKYSYSRYGISFDNATLPADESLQDNRYKAKWNK